MKMSCSRISELRPTLPLILALSFLMSCGKGKSPAGASPGATGSAPQSAISVAASLESFEGELGVVIKPGAQVNQGKQVGPINLQVKNGKIRIDAPAELEQLQGVGRAHLVIAALDKKIFAVLDGRKEVVSVDLDKIGEQLKHLAPSTAQEAPGRASPEKAPKITKTGRKDKLAGRDCEDWEIAAERGKAVICVADDGVPWLKLPALGVPSEHAWIGELLDGRHFPLRMVALEKDGQESGRLEVTKFERKALAAQLFEIPAGYRTVDLQQAIQELMMAAMGGRAMPPDMPPGLPPDIAAKINAARSKAPKAPK